MNFFAFSDKYVVENHDTNVLKKHTKLEKTSSDNDRAKAAKTKINIALTTERKNCGTDQKCSADSPGKSNKASRSSRKNIKVSKIRWMDSYDQEEEKTKQEEKANESCI